MSLAEFESVLWRTMGLDPAAIGASDIERAVRERQAACGMQDQGAYLEHLRGSERELQELVEAIVVPETWFFRHEDAFAAIVRIARTQLQQGAPDRVLRLLSLPCATGEEPYSMAMALLDAGVPPARFRIDAVDISERTLERAEAGVYGRNSFRARDLGFRERHFTPDGEGTYRLSAAVRRQVELRHGNVLAPAFPVPAAGYDVVFCRNLLIYLERTMQQRALEVLARLMGESGSLFVGPSEASLCMNPAFIAEKLEGARAFRKAPPGAARTRPELPRIKPQPAAKKPLVPSSMAAPPPVAVRSSVAAPVAAAAPGLGEAARLANEGRLAEAAELCERAMQADGPSADAFQLLGLLHDAQGRPEQAAAHYRKALYLDPAHQEALLHLASLLARQGDGDGARRLRERAARATSKAQRG